MTEMLRDILARLENMNERLEGFTKSEDKQEDGNYEGAHIHKSFN